MLGNTISALIIDVGFLKHDQANLLGSRNQNLYEITINQELVSKRECFWPKSEVDLFAFLANFLHFCINFQHLCKLLVTFHITHFNIRKNVHKLAQALQLAS